MDKSEFSHFFHVNTEFDQATANLFKKPTEASVSTSDCFIKR